MSEMTEVRPRKKKKRKKKRYLLRLCIFLAILAAAFCVAHLKFFDVTEIYVSGNDSITDEEVVKLAGIETGQSIFDVHPLLDQRKIAKNMFVEDVNIDRKLPGTVEIEITERSGMAQLAYGKKFVVTDNTGEVLAINNREYQIATIRGLKVKKAKLGHTISTDDDATFMKLINVIRQAEDNDMYFKLVTMSHGKVLAYIYDDLKCKGRYTNLISCLKSGMLKSVVYDLYQKGTEKGVIRVSTNNYCFFTEEN